MNFLALLIATSVYAAGFNPQCPPKISPVQDLPNPPQNWKKFFDKVNTVYSLEKVDFYDGPPEKLAQIMPDDNGIWSFRALQGGEANYEVCSYSGTSMKISRPIPNSIKSCRANYEPTSGPHAVHTLCGNPAIKNIECK